MRRAGPRTAAIVAAAGLVVAATTLSAPVAAWAATPGPTIRLLPAQQSITLPQYGRQTFLDPGIWIATAGSALEFDVQRASYTKPVTLTQIIHLPGGGTRVRPLPRTLLNGWNGLRDFVRMTVRDHRGKVVAGARLTFCPDSFDPQRASPDSPATSPYPQQCGAFDPFPKATVWGVAKGWAVDPAETFGTVFNLPLGTYQVTDTITGAYARLFRISARNATATVNVTLV
jgi:hypothetical protein